MIFKMVFFIWKSLFQRWSRILVTWYCDLRLWSYKTIDVSYNFFFCGNNTCFIFFVKVLPSAGRTWTSFSGRYGWRASSWPCSSHPRSPSPRATGSSWSRSSRRVEESPAREPLLDKVSYAFVLDREPSILKQTFFSEGLAQEARRNILDSKV